MSWESITNREDRGITPVVAVILLVGLVAMTATVTMIAGMSLMETIESQQEFEEAESDMQVIQSELQTASTSQDALSSLVSTNENVRISDGATVTLETVDDTGDPVAVQIPMQSLVRDTDDGHVILEGGGIFITQDGHTTVSSPPDVRISDDGLDISLTNFEGETGYASDELTIQTDPGADIDEQTREDFEEVVGAFISQGEQAELVVTVESQQADAWEQHFQNQAEGTSDWGIETTRLGEEEVAVTIRRGGLEQDGVLIHTEHALDTEHDYIVGTNENQVFVDPTLENAEDDPVEPELQLSIYDEDDTLLEEERVRYDGELSPGDATVVGENNNEWDRLDEDGNVDNSGNAFFNPRSNGNRALDLTVGERYSYEIETQPGGNIHEGWFYYVDITDIDGGFVFEDVRTETNDGEIVIAADITNIDDSADKQDIELDIEGVGDPIVREELLLDSGETDTVGWVLDESSFPQGTYEFTLSTESEIDNEQVEYDGTITAPNVLEAFRITDDLGISEDDWISGQHIVSSEDDVTIRAEITNQHPDQETQDVGLEVEDEYGGLSASTTESVTLDSGESEVVELTVGALEGSDSGELYEYTIKTDDDELDDAGAFLVVDEPSEFEITEYEIDGAIKAGSPLTVDVDIDNQGPEDEQFILLTDFDDEFVASNEVEIDGWSTANDVSLTWGEVVPADEGAITVSTATDSQTIARPGDIDPFVDITDVRIDGPVEQGDSATVEVDITTTGDVPDDHIMRLTGPDETLIEHDLGHGEGTIEFEYDTGSDAITDRLTAESYDQANNVVDDEQGEVLVIQRDGPVCGTVDYEKDEDGFYLIETVDQLQCINEHGLDENYRLANDIDAHGTEYWNNGAGFNPIGPEGHNYPNEYVQSDEHWNLDHEPFQGHFDGNGHAVHGLSVDRPEENFVGLFGATGYTQDYHPDTGGDVAPGDGSLIENIRLTDVYISGNQHVGGLAGQAGGTVLDARSEGYVEGQEQLVGGLVGDGAHADMDNRVVSSGTVIGGPITATGYDALNHEGIGGLVGRATWNTQVSTAYTQTDVTGPEYVGAIVGTSSYRDSEFRQMYTTGSATATDLDTDAGAVVGTVLSNGDEFKDSVYWNQDVQTDPYGEAGNWFENVNINAVQTDWNGRTTDQMTGLDVTSPGQMSNLEFEEDGGPWVAIPGEYPRFAWELAAEGQFEVDIDDAKSDTSATAGDDIDIETTVTSRYADRDADATETQTLTLIGPDGDIVGTEEVTIDSTLGEDEQEDVTITWRTNIQDDGNGQQLTVRTEDSFEDTITVDLDEPERGVGSSNPEVNDEDIDLGDDVGTGDVEDKIDITDEIDIGVDVIEIS